MMKNKSHEIDMCNGSLFGKMLLFTVPLILSSLLQLLFNAADMVVAGRYAGDTALASISATSSLTNLIVNVFIGLSVGSNVLVARFYGAGQHDDLHETIQTSVIVSFLSGVFLAVFGFFIARPALTLMGTPDNVINGSVVYMRIYFAGMPFSMLYNFCAAMLRAVGDTKRPLYFLSAAGVINVLLNLFFVIVIKMGVGGVALATIISQALSAFLVLGCLIKNDTEVVFDPKNLHVCKDKIIRMAQIGLPAGIQGSIFSISNVLIQSSINSFGSDAMSGSAAAQNIEGFVYVIMNSFHHTALSFTSQNVGGKKYKRINKIVALSVFFATVSGFASGMLAYTFGHQLLSIYNPNETIIAYGLIRMKYILPLYFTCGIMDTFVGSLRGLGKSIMPMIVSLLGACAFRIIWIYTVFAANHTLECLFTSYPVSWILTASIHFICFCFVKRKFDKMCQTEPSPLSH